ncbi:glycerophosphodiester phosphodiesterase [Microbacterium sp. VKM Ac-2870]|uniref:glycerophosphodiester phosphodiesterase family protein n=1 Tax=Microbacterium sp. VKM Ac-2870 TaxID=2783825 RepID=UPI00188D40F1|nr:glycerophosphodiester phosphodiesterase family protein [Microbacterium sp. VKM Ac-2870]MBF4561507.1 glycerophosphodiester phosphodiesterase [Microbacterium sp. VKM Ac-2870]
MAFARPLVIGHRGAPGYRPEHTRSSYALALEQGVDAVEPDVVFTSDGVAVVRHENEIGGTTDVADHPEFASRRRRKTVDGAPHTGWFAEDFTWDELATLRCRERVPLLRPASAAFDDTEPPLRLRDLLDLVRSASRDQGRRIGVVLEVKHATFFTGLGIDVAGLLAAELRAAGWADGILPLYVESFEQTVLTDLRGRGIRGTFIYLLESDGTAVDLRTAQGEAAPTYREQVSPTGLDRLVGEVDGISVDKKMILAPDERGRPTGPSRVVADAHDRGLLAFTWTCRPENAFLLPAFQRGDAPAQFGDYASEWRIIADAAVDGVFVDHADLGVAFFR